MKLFLLWVGLGLTSFLLYDYLPGWVGVPFVLFTVFLPILPVWIGQLLGDKDALSFQDDGKPKKKMNPDAWDVLVSGDTDF